eukprot:128449-Pleurochrysis_carterae.AAC.2
MVERAEGMGWAGAPSGEVEVTIRRSPTAPPEPLTISALLSHSGGMAAGVLAPGAEGGGRRGAAPACWRSPRQPARLPSRLV